MRPELTYCAVCGGVILPADTAEQDGDEWTCELCGGEPAPDVERDWNDAVAFERGTLRLPRDPRDEYDGGEALRFINF